jgi:molybdopterin synthase sulfur carrier subunit
MNRRSIESMSVKVRIPAPLRSLTGGVGEASIDGGSLQAGIDQLETSFPGMKDRLCDSDGDLRRFVNIYVNGEDVRFLDNLDTELKTGDEISIVPAVAGG